VQQQQRGARRVAGLQHVHVEAVHAGHAARTDAGGQRQRFQER
jgi:hypothetical protein